MFTDFTPYSSIYTVYELPLQMSYMLNEVNVFNFSREMTLLSLFQMSYIYMQNLRSNLLNTILIASKTFKLSTMKINLSYQNINTK
jgi:hypothetical protein